MPTTGKQQPTRHYRLVFTKEGSDYARRIAYAYLDHALAKAAQNLVRGAVEYRIVQINEAPDGSKKDGVQLAAGSRENGTISFSMGRHASTIVKRESEPLWWPSWATKKESIHK